MIMEKVCAFFIHVTSFVCECRCDAGCVNVLLLHGTEHGKIFFILQYPFRDIQYFQYCMFCFWDCYWKMDTYYICMTRTIYNCWN